MDLTPTEFTETYLNLAVPETRRETIRLSGVPNSVDWRGKGVLNNVKN